MRTVYAVRIFFEMLSLVGRAEKAEFVHEQPRTKKFETERLQRRQFLNDDGAVCTLFVQKPAQLPTPWA